MSSLFSCLGYHFAQLWLDVSSAVQANYCLTLTVCGLFNGSKNIKKILKYYEHFLTQARGMWQKNIINTLIVFLAKYYESFFKLLLYFITYKFELQLDLNSKHLAPHHWAPRPLGPVGCKYILQSPALSALGDMSIGRAATC